MRSKLYPTNSQNQNRGCSQCGFHISHHTSFETVLAGKFDNSENGGYTAYRSTPLRQSTIESDFLVPLGQSVVWSLVSSLPAIPVSIWLRYEWYFPATVAAFGLLASWYRSMSQSRNSLCTIEEFTYEPNVVDPGKLATRPALAEVRLDVTDRSDVHQAGIKFVDLPRSIDVQTFNEFCFGVVAGKGLARKDWTPKRVLLSRDQYDSLISKMVTSGIVRDDGEGQKKLTPGGKRALARYVKEVRM